MKKEEIKHGKKYGELEVEKENKICANCGKLESEHIDYFKTGKKNVCPHRKSMTFQLKEKESLSDWIFEFKNERPDGENTFILTPKVKEKIHEFLSELTEELKKGTQKAEVCKVCWKETEKEIEKFALEKFGRKLI